MSANPRKQDFDREKMTPEERVTFDRAVAMKRTFKGIYAIPPFGRRPKRERTAKRPQRRGGKTNAAKKEARGWS